ncbi:protein BREAKING OF ASYMMETRY IN THE STOMATAL LINEAGE [Salvia miltiorrhiza]|uniref:protein BREAKING OF ASYMMETRY IN THE STOMATAL LINEAGE n=1 Tax=Salvia miltiorrhiza TaxID=226208 RepID=UPI0025ABA4FA|nr:protein BREAKING OF ASYMMETRY IN THE STOMATAL LINEAGE [Salvia miltiorrhiza]
MTFILPSSHPIQSIFDIEEKSDGRSPETSSGSIVLDFTAAKKSRGKSVQTSPSRANTINGEPHVAEEDYLVFCFREDGAIDIVNDGNEDDGDGDGDGGGYKNVTAHHTGEEKESKDYEIKEIKMDQFGACDSNLSDTSSGSFAFPILKIEEWIGSPVHMPKQENQSIG